MTPVLTMTETSSHPHNARRQSFFSDDHGVVHPTPAPRFSTTPCPTPSPSPAPGQDTQAILADLGHTSSDIERLLAECVVRVTDPISQNGPK